MSTVKTERIRVVSFDGGAEEVVQYLRPDRYRTLELDLGSGPRIARGGGYSYAPAGFGAGSLVLDMTRFNRVLRFDPQNRTMEVEAGMTLDDLFELTVKRDLWLPIIPGYPGITVGGCIAANVHGKNPFRHGVFAHVVKDLRIFHPAHGFLRISPESRPDLFELTIGGYGLTGIIVSATLILEPLVGDAIEMRRQEVSSLEEAAEALRDLSEKCELAYSFHYGAPFKRAFGRGFVYSGTAIRLNQPDTMKNRQHQTITANSREVFPFSLWGGLRTLLFQRIHRIRESLRPTSRAVSLYEASFPFSSGAPYFLFYGKRGLLETQVIVPQDALGDFLESLRRLVLAERPSSVMISLKRFKGETRLLRFEGDGFCVTTDLARTRKTLDFMKKYDELTMSLGAIPNIGKDSRLPRSVVSSCYPECELFKRRLSHYDPKRIFRSELSERLGL